MEITITVKDETRQLQSTVVVDEPAIAAGATADDVLEQMRIALRRAGRPRWGFA